MSIEHYRELEQSRRDCYKLMAACFYQPQKDLFLEEKVFENLGRLLKRVCPDAVQFAEKMEASVLQYSNEELLVEYARLFVGPNELLAPPYGSIYLEEGGRVMGESTTRAMEFYKAEGLSLDAHFSNLPDHIAAELEFMYYLSFNLVDAVEKMNIEKALYFLNKREAFKNTFLDRWVVPFCTKINAGTENEFYRALAGCLSAYITEPGNSTVPEELKAGVVRI